MIKYSLIANDLTPEPNDYRAQTHAAGVFDKEAVIEHMLQRGSLVTRTDILAVFNDMEEAVVDLHRQGYTVNLPLFGTSFSIKGRFDRPEETFSTDRHRLNINVHRGRLLTHLQRDLRPEKTDRAPAQPTIHQVTDLVSGVQNERLTPGGVVEIVGRAIKIVGNDASVGLWFMAADGSKTRATITVHNKPSTVLAVIPTLAPGTYSVRIVTQYLIGGGLLKHPKFHVFDKALIVD